MKQTNGTQHLKTVSEHMEWARKTGVALQVTEDQELHGRAITLGGNEIVNFGSCSYLGLEQDARVKAGIIEAVEKYGSQFSSSRSYVSIGLYDELEFLLGQMFGAPAVVTASTTLGHFSALPVLVGEKDVIIMDHQVHASVSMAAQVLKAKGVRVEMIRHNHLDMLENRIEKLKSSHERIWYLADGMYSMYGDFTPLAGLKELLARHEQLRLYIDDAHGISWTGKHGSGTVAPQLAGHPQVVITGSLNKSFAAAGGVLIFPDEETKRMVRNCGGTLIFSGPVQPPMLGAAIASANIHLSDELPRKQESLLRKIRLFNRMAEMEGLPLVSDNESPIRFISVGKPEVGYNMVQRIMSSGYYLNLAAYPSVPYKNTGLRIALNDHLHPVDIMNLVKVIVKELPYALAEESYSIEDVYAAFRYAKAS
ncbi:MAG: aminotransferase class I/II-fold pyridoxal phosphate-dependent enzyme [Bacteroidota bacterium]